MNPNDFALRNTRYEGSDSGLYRMYHPPLLKAPWFARKLTYRLHKGDNGVVPSADWYRWTFEGTREKDLPRLLEMKRFADEQGMRFGVTLLAVGTAYEGEGAARRYALADLDQAVRDYCAREQIPFIDEVALFAHAEGAWDITDHPTPAGSTLLADLLIQSFLSDIE